ncbi:hypothetical protein DERF_010127 [Dermatophagoides farinae]|uniref:FHA domain-containing protein n=1 Tax=Dermatophagoides farinae TaxID=6954 RepID=A0A922L285_DERFA|nr:hypothetical protein DERF_010127 [Dermatophagoides farinae]
MSSSPPLTSNLMKSNTNGQKIDTELLKPNSLSSSSTTTVAASNGTVSIMNTCNNKMIEDDANSLLVNNGDNTFIISSSADVENNLLSMQTFVTNHNNNNVNNIDHPNKVNINSCDQENYSIDKDNDDYDNEDDDDDDDDDADRTLKSNPTSNDENYSKIKNAAIINNNNRQNQNLNVIINGDSSIESSSSSPIQQQQPNTSPIFVDLNNKLSNTTMIESAKVGRSIGRTSTSLNNAIFDCKVLSRNHALFWYEDGKFYLKDTCSSNGTFVNGHRLSTTNERSLPQVVYSGDCIQFGVEVTEKKNVHSCVIATIRLFHPDGTEATKDHNHRLLADGCFDDGDRQFLLNYPNSSIQIPPSQLIDLVCQIHQSVQKQRLLEQQLDSTRQIMKEALDSAKNGWRSLVEEDRFLSRIQTLQAQLEVCLIAKNRDSPESSIIEALKQNNLKLIADKEKFEQESKCSLQKALENKILTETNLQTAKTRLNAKIDECRLLQESLDSNVKELKCLAQNCDKLKKEKDELMAKMKRLEDEDMKFKQQKFANNSGQQIQQQVVAVKKSTTSTNTILPIMMDQNVQTMIDVNDEKQVRKLSENHQQTQTDYRNESVDVRDSTSIEPKQYEQVKNFLLNHYEQMEICNQSIVKQLSMIDDLIDEKLKSMDTTIIRVQSIIDEIVKNLQRKNQQCSSLLRQQNESLQQQIDENNKLKCDIQCLHIQLQESNREHQTNDGSINNILKLEKSIQVEQQQIEPKLLMATTQNNEDLQQQQTSSSSKMLMLKHLTMAIDVEDDDGDETVAIQNDEQIDCDNIDQILMKKMDKLIQRNQILMANNECLNQEIESLKEKHDLLSLQNQVSLGIAVLPLFVIFVCFVLVLYQPLSFITGTFGL